MSSKRQEERNEKIIRGLMKLPPNRRCINCNSLGPQYVCTNFWTFVCMTCSGIHREFTHRVKSISMAKFTSQEVDALQKGGNQRARELLLMAWDPQRQKLPDNSNADKVREFIKNVYVDKRYAVDKSSDRPPRDPQSREDETRRASSYHSYSQSPPYDFQYEERRYGKHVPSLTRKPGSDRGLYEGKLSSFLSPSRLSSANEGSYPRVSDYSVSSGGDPFKSDVLSPSSQRELGSPFSETSSRFSSEISGTGLHHSDANNVNNGGRIRHPQRTTSSGSFGSFDSMSFKSVNSVGLQEVASESEQSVATSLDKTSSLPSLPPQSSTSATFNGVDLFSEPFTPQNVTSVPFSSVSTFSEQQPTQSHFNSKTSDAVMPNNGGWATFDAPQNMVSVGTENSFPATMSSWDGNNPGNFNPFSLDRSSSNQNSAYHEPSSASTHALWHDGQHNVETTTSNAPFWNAFEDYPVQQPARNVVKDSDRAAVLHASDDYKSRGFGVYKVDGNVRTPNEIEPPSSSLSSHLMVHDFSMVPVVAGVHLPELKPTNPFDLPFDADLQSSNSTEFWDMSSLQAALSNNHTPALYIGDANESWFPLNSVATYASGGATFDHPSAGSFASMFGQAPSTQILTVPQGPVASIGGNPFA